MMSDKSTSNSVAPKRRSSPDSDRDDSMSPEKRMLNGVAACARCGDVKLDKISTWKAYGVDNILGKLQLNRQCITLPDDNLTGFISERPGSFQFQQVKECDQQQDFEEYLRILDRCMDFDVLDADLKVHNVTYQYGGYDRNLPNASKSPIDIKEVFSKFERCYSQLEQQPKIMMNQKGSEHLVKYFYYAMDFIEVATKVLMKPTAWQERKFEDLFRALCRLSGLQLQAADGEAPHHVHIFGEEVSGSPNLRAYVPIDNDWRRQKPVTSQNVPMLQTLSAIVEVKLSPPSGTDAVEEETENVLGPVVGKMLAELMSFKDVLAGGHTHMLGIIVLSTKVYFVKLYVPESLMDTYRAGSRRRCPDQDVEKGTVFVTQGFDFMKRKSRFQVLQILHKIATISKP